MTTGRARFSEHHLLISATSQSAALSVGILEVATDLSPEYAEALRLFNSWKHRQRPQVPADGRAREPQHIYAELMKNDFAPALRSAGLRGSNGRFELPSETH